MRLKLYIAKTKQKHQPKKDAKFNLIILGKKFYTFQTIFAESQKKNPICKYVYANELYL